LALVKAELQAIKANQLSGNQKVTLSDSEDLAQDVTVQGVKSELEEVTSELELVKAELQAIKANQLSGNQKVTLSGTKVVESAPVTGIKTVTSTVAEVFAGSSRKANRSKAGYPQPSSGGCDPHRRQWHKPTPSDSLWNLVQVLR